MSAVTIELTKGKQAVVDACDVGLVQSRKWHCLNGRYAAHKPLRQPAVLMHRLIMNAPKGLFVDHIDGDGLNNRRNNLRLVEPAANSWNRRQAYVSFNRKSGKWGAVVCPNRLAITVGEFDVKAEAEVAHKLATQILGDFPVDLRSFDAAVVEKVRERLMRRIETIQRSLSAHQKLLGGIS